MKDRMTGKISKYWILTLLLTLLPAGLNGQERYALGAGYEIVTPVGELGNRFLPAQALVFRLRLQEAQRHRVTLQYRDVVFDETKADKLFYKGIPMRLENRSLSLNVQYHLWQPADWLCLSLSGEASLNRWEFKREAFLAEDSVNGDIDLAEFAQDDWSWGGKAGLCLTLSPFEFLQFGASMHYHLMIAELWPALKLRLENVSGLQMLETQLFIELSHSF